MGGVLGSVLKCIEFLAIAAGVGGSITNEVLEEKIRAILKEHQHEF